MRAGHMSDRGLQALHNKGESTPREGRIGSANLMTINAEMQII